MRNHGTEYTICNVKVVVEKGRLTGIEEETLIRDANRISARLMEGLFQQSQLPIITMLRGSKEKNL